MQLNDEDTRAKFVGIEERRRRLQARRSREQRRLDRTKQQLNPASKMAANDGQVLDGRMRKKGEKHLQREAMKRAKQAKGNKRFLPFFRHVGIVKSHLIFFAADAKREQARQKEQEEQKKQQEELNRYADLMKKVQVCRDSPPHCFTLFY